MKDKLLKIEEQGTTAIACAAGIIASILATAFVMIFLDGTPSDLIALIAGVYCLVTYIVDKRFPQATKFLLACSPAVGAVIIIVSNTGHYSAMDQTYFLCLIVSVIHYDVYQVLLSAGTVLVTNIAGIILFPEPYLKIHNMTVWTFVLFIYMMSVICALIIAGRTHNLFEKERQLQIQQCELVHLKQLEKKSEEHAKFIHNIHHYLVAIGNLASEQDCENILNILKDMNVEITNQQSLVYTTHPVMNAILSQKFSHAESEQIPMDIYVEPGIPFQNISDGDMIIMLGNLLDNALEAVQKSEGITPFIKVRIYKENEGKIGIIKIENPFLTPVNYNHKGLILTNKKDDLHGYGLRSVDETAKKYGGYLQCSQKNHIFTSILILSLDNHNNILS